MGERDNVLVHSDGWGVVDAICAQFCTLRAEVEGLTSQHMAGTAREKELSLDVSQLSNELEQQRADRLRMEAKLKASRLEANQLRKDGLMKDKELTELISTRYEEGIEGGRHS